MFNAKLLVLYYSIENEMLCYDISEDQLLEIPLNKDMRFAGNCFNVIDDKIYFTTKCYDRNFWSHSLVCYDISDDSFTRIGEPPHIDGTNWYSFHDRMYIRTGGYPAFSLGYTDLGDKNLYFHEICNNISIGTYFYSVKDGILFVDDNRNYTLQYLNFKNGTVTQLASVKFDVHYSEFFSIGDWVYYNPYIPGSHGWKKVRLSDPADSQPVAWT